MPIYPLFGLSQKGKSPAVTSQRHLNLYAEVVQDADKSSLAFYGTPGLLSNASFGETPIRGMIGIGDFVYVVHRGYLWKLANDGTKTQCGTLNTAEGRVAMAYNGTQIGLVDGSAYYVYIIASNTFQQVTTNLIGTPIDITYLDSYFILAFSNSQQYQITAQYDGTTLDALDFASAESNPDGLVRILGDHGELILAGSATVEFAANTGSQDFPYASIKSATLEYGLAAPYSLVKFNDSVAGLFRNEQMGQIQPMMLRGHALAPLGNDQTFASICTIINSYSSPEDATAYSYMLGGHPMFQVNFTKDNKSWLFDNTTGLWSELEYGINGGRHRGEIRVSSNGKTLVSDYANGNIYTLDPETYTDNGQPVAREIIGKHVNNGAGRLAIHALHLGVETGVGLADGSAPQMMLQISKDNGRTWGTVLRTSIGAIGEYLARAVWRRLGSARDWLFKFRITDPVKVVITGVDINPEPRK